MSISTDYQKYTLNFKRPAGTSRGVYTEKISWFIQLINGGYTGVGEASPLVDLSIDDRSEFETILKDILTKIEGHSLPKNQEEVFEMVSSMVPEDYPSIRFCLESALLDLLHGGMKIIYPGAFERGEKQIPINGLIWMGAEDFMLEQIKDKLAQGYNTIKIKVGAIDFEKECQLLKFIREKHDASEIKIRLDANGAFQPEEALDKLDRLSNFEVHSIEQPIKQGQWAAMNELCRKSPIPIALDEELIGVLNKDQLLDEIQPPYIILKPTLHGGLSGSAEWINAAEKRGIGWWITSALESNIGLNSIAQFCATYNPELPQGLGTGQLFTNNIDSPLFIEKGYLGYDPDTFWQEI